jgi:hypothetical protein
VVSTISFPPWSNGVTRIGHQAHHDLLYLHRISLDLAELRLWNEVQLDVFTDQSEQYPANMLEHTIEIEHPQGLHLP